MFFRKPESQDQASQMWFSGRLFIQESVLYLKQTTSHGKDPPDHLRGMTEVGQKGQPAEGKSHQHCWSNSHQQEKPTDTERQASSLTAGGTDIPQLMKTKAVPNKIWIVL